MKKTPKRKFGEIEVLIVACQGPCAFRPLRWTPGAKKRDAYNYLLECPTCQKAQCRICMPDGARECLTCSPKPSEEAA